MDGAALDHCTDRLSTIAAAVSAVFLGRRVRSPGYFCRAGQSGGTTLLTRCGHRLCIAAFETL
jgi:hypothetical protein